MFLQMSCDYNLVVIPSMDPEDYFHTSVHKGFSLELSIEDLFTGEVLPSST